MAMLHIVNKSPFERRTLLSCLDTAQAGGAVLLIEDAVVCATTASRFADTITQAMQRQLAFYALAPDFSARGFSASQALAGIKLIGYGDFVDLVAAHDTVQSWL